MACTKIRKALSGQLLIPFLACLVVFSGYLTYMKQGGMGSAKIVSMQHTERKEIKSERLRNIINHRNANESTDHDDGEEDSEFADANEDQELQALADAEASNVTRYTGNKKLETYYNHPLMTVCGLFTLKHAGIYAVTKVISTQTHEECRTKCADQERLYAILKRGTCYCGNTPDRRQFLDLESCDATCAADEARCKIYKKPHQIAMRTVARDGADDWTVWMSVPVAEVKVRYRGCQRDKTKQTFCTPSFERKTRSDEEVGESEILSNRLIGCFTGQSISVSGTVYNTTLSNGSHYDCVSTCRRKRSAYTVLSTSRKRQNASLQCLCTDSLAKSRPTDSCSGLGFAVYWSSGSNEKITLKELPSCALSLPPSAVKDWPASVRVDNAAFEERIRRMRQEDIFKFDSEATKKGKVLVLARYRSGSSMTQSFFVRYPKSMILFEPGKLKAEPSVKPTVSSDRMMLMALESFFGCDALKIPPHFYNHRYLMWSTNMLRSRGQDNNYMTSIMECINARPPVDCAPYWQEACEHAEFLNVKVIRVFSVPAVREFILRNTDVHVVHLVRDPRGLLAAQKSFGRRSPADFICGQLLHMGQMIRDLKAQGNKTAHEVFYEQLAVNASYYGAKIFREMGIDMPEEVKRFISREDSGEGPLHSNSTKHVVVDDPYFHVYRFLQRYQMEAILDIDKNCNDVYKFWPEHYSEFWTMYKEHKREIEDYVSRKNKIFITKYLGSHKEDIL